MPHYHFPFSSFSRLFHERVHDSQLSQHIFLSYYDDDHSVHRTYTYSQFGETVARMVTVLRDRLGIQREDRLATVLFNHDQTVLVYFAAWTLGIFAKCPKVILFGDVVPYTTTGKPKRLKLKSRLSETLSIYRDQCFKEC